MILRLSKFFEFPEWQLIFVDDEKKCQASHYFSNVLHSASMEIQNDSGSEKKLKCWSDENDNEVNLEIKLFCSNYSHFDWLNGARRRFKMMKLTSFE